MIAHTLIEGATVDQRSVGAFAATELKDFRKMQTTMNLYLRSIEVAIALARQSLEGKSEGRAIDDVWEVGLAPRDVLEKYKHKGTSGETLPYTIGEFKAHLPEAQEYFFRSVLVFYLAAFERFLKRWTTFALELLPLNALNPADIKKLKNRAHTPHLNVRVVDLAQVFEEAVKRLEAKQPVNRHSAVAKRFFTKHEWSCMEATEMWRHVRNAIVHHDGALDKIGKSKSDDYRAMWMDLSKHSPREHPGNMADSIVARRVSLQGKLVVYCFTNTMETVKALVDHLKELEGKLGERPAACNPGVTPKR